AMRILLSIFFVICSAATNARSAEEPVLTAEAFLTAVKLYHPIARQAGINVASAKAGQLVAKGMFDPVFSAAAAKKNFDGVQYYHEVQPQLSLPTWYGVELYAGTGYLTGDRLNPTETAGETSYAGISIPLAKNLLMDKRRAALKTARILSSLSVVEREVILNDMLLEAAGAYWEWVTHYESLAVAKEAVALSGKRLQFVISSFQLGERAAVDTVEALAQLQYFEYLLSESELHFLNATVALSAYLWLENGEPAPLPEDLRPMPRTLDKIIFEANDFSTGNSIDSAVAQHPALRQYGYQLRGLDIERRLKFQELLPSVNLKYNQLGKGYNVAKTAAGFLTENNYRYGLSLTIPLRLSAG
ncbi:MAG: hypothetical protein EOP49_50310, partial [Sphingobacteriales bacterium]